MAGEVKFNKTSRRYALGTVSGITILVLMLAGGATAATPVNSCMNISSPGGYVLTSNLTGSATCIRINSSDVVFDGAGYTITGKGISSTYGVYVNNSSSAIKNVTVKNLKVTKWGNDLYQEFKQQHAQRQLCLAQPLWHLYAIFRQQHPDQ